MVPRSVNNAPDIAGLADLCLGYLAEHPEELIGFMQTVGYTPQSLRSAVGSEQFQHGLIDYFASNEPILLAFCANANLNPESFMHTWHKLNPAG